MGWESQPTPLLNKDDNINCIKPKKKSSIIFIIQFLCVIYILISHGFTKKKEKSHYEEWCILTKKILGMIDPLGISLFIW